MRYATISETKNRLSAVLDRVKAGETILITDRGVPVARIEPIIASDDPTGRIDRLTRAGLVRPGTGLLPARLTQRPAMRSPGGLSAVDAVIEERRSGW
jgi:prevent-host-death family protein